MIPKLRKSATSLMTLRTLSAIGRSGDQERRIAMLPSWSLLDPTTAIGGNKILHCTRDLVAQPDMPRRSESFEAMELDRLLNTFEGQHSDNWLTGQNRIDWSRLNRQLAVA